jgi:hypothetical protein
MPLIAHGHVGRSISLSDPDETRWGRASSDPASCFGSRLGDQIKQQQFDALRWPRTLLGPLAEVQTVITELRIAKARKKAA